MMTVASRRRCRTSTLGPALLWLALLPGGCLCHAQSVPAPARLPAAAPMTYDQDYAALCKAVGDHFYDPGFNGLDWPVVRAEYARRVKSVTKDAQFLALMNDLLARLHASPPLLRPGRLRVLLAAGNRVWPGHSPAEVRADA